MDTKKESEIHFESYFCTLSMLKRNNNEEVSKCTQQILHFILFVLAYVLEQVANTSHYLILFSAVLLMLYGTPKSKSMRR
jgi:hypothetical protein